MIDRVTPEPSQDELTAIRTALARRTTVSPQVSVARIADMCAHDLEFAELRAAARARAPRPT